MTISSAAAWDCFIAVSCDNNIYTADQTIIALDSNEIYCIPRIQLNASSKLIVYLRDELTDEILKISNKYKSKEEVQKAMSTSNDAAYEFVDAVEKTLNSRIEAANQFEKDLRTEEGRAKIIKEANRINVAKEKRKAEAAAKAAEASKDTTEEDEETQEEKKEPKLTPEQKKYKNK